jgi:hypothetical protein
MDLIGVPGWVPRPGRMMAGAALRDMQRIADQAIDGRRGAARGKVPDLLDLLLEGEDNIGAAGQSADLCRGGA